MTKETERHVMRRTMELKRKNKLVCYPKLFEADFGDCDLNIANRIAADLKFDETKKKECTTRDYNKKLRACEERQNLKEETVNA